MEVRPFVSERFRLLKFRPGSGGDSYSVEFGMGCFVVSDLKKKLKRKRLRQKLKTKRLQRECTTVIITAQQKGLDNNLLLFTHYDYRL